MKLTVKQKNCPYCHKPFQSIPLFNGEVLLRIEEDGGEYSLMVEGNGDPEDVGILSMVTDGQLINGCPFCRRPLNEEEE
ncbi:hypothetical protein LMB76_04265 [Limosilactobacillus reuteri]|uniref:Uncharacterized protein n=1 Tax=Limosilactobacillus reuteri TaxID=1598 RepID=A0AAW4X509_LIMRT|nr:hypothetical protein [Limosilactobacillus reuteri]MCC4477432.1 hypothetical protein [Limosilactobacillus reuteri]MCC4479709.1 hypothetical protein [Limosilactobacillus reuteri]MCC4488985.1 hypothetical protein [Limosilactobacillus reuteri]MCC4493316.1 hypothetical protein [Limosilactobacillus reuteri]MCC4496012.1 hypothetical protein [Limosilactobacillus reuteri]